MPKRALFLVPNVNGRTGGNRSGSILVLRARNTTPPAFSLLNTSVTQAKPKCKKCHRCNMRSVSSDGIHMDTLRSCIMYARMIIARRTGGVMFKCSAFAQLQREGAVLAEVTFSFARGAAAEWTYIICVYYSCIYVCCYNGAVPCLIHMRF